MNDGLPDSGGLGRCDSFRAADRNPPPGSTGKIIVETVRRFKGLDSPVAILVELEDVIDDAPLMHVAITRARSHLVVIGADAVVRTIAEGPVAVDSPGS